MLNLSLFSKYVFTLFRMVVNLFIIIRKFYGYLPAINYVCTAQCQIDLFEPNMNCAL